MQSHQIFLLHQLRHLKNELSEIYLNQIIRKIAISLIGIFVPVYLFSLGFPIQVSLIFMFFEYLGIGLFSPLAGYLSSKFGIKHVIGASSLLYLIYFYGLALVDVSTSLYSIYGLSLFFGFANSLYWIGIHSDFVKHSNKLHEGSDSGKLIGLPEIAGVIAPFIGGFVLAYLGYLSLSVIVIFLTILSIVPLFFTPDSKKPFKMKISNLKIFAEKSLCPTYFLWGAAHVFLAVFWPLFIFFSIRDFTQLGITTTIAGAGSAFLILFIGNLSDRYNRSKIIKMGALLSALVWFHRIFITNVYEIAISSFLTGLLFILINVPLYANFCDFSKKGNIVGGVIFRELWFTIGRLLVLSVLLIFSLFSPEAFFDMGFVFAGILSLMFLAFRTK